LSNGRVDVRTEWRESREIRDNRGDGTIGVDHSRLRDVLTGDGPIGTSQHVVVAKDVLRGAVGDEGAESTAATEAFCAIVDVSTGNPQVLISSPVGRQIALSVTRRNESAAN
jgi:hypothetical protein